VFVLLFLNFFNNSLFSNNYIPKTQFFWFIIFKKQKIELWTINGLQYDLWKFIDHHLEEREILLNTQGLEEYVHSSLKPNTTHFQIKRTFTRG